MNTIHNVFKCGTKTTRSSVSKDIPNSYSTFRIPSFTKSNYNRFQRQSYSLTTNQPRFNTKVNATTLFPFVKANSSLDYFRVAKGKDKRSEQPTFEFGTEQPYYGKTLLGGLLSIVGLASGLTVYNWYYQDEVPLSGRKRVLDVSYEAEMEMASKAFDEVLRKHGDKILPEDHPYVQDVKRVGMNLIKSSGLPNLENLNWEFIVIENDLANAFVLPGGKVCVFTGIIPLMKDDDGMAIVLSHEIAHILARHGAEHWSIARFWIATDYLLRSAGMTSLADKVLNRILASPFSKQCEAEADHIGLLLMSKGAYNVNKALDMWKRMKDHEESTDFHAYLETHPSFDERIELLQKLMPAIASHQCAAH